jgi:hypothetical protein
MRKGGAEMRDRLIELIFDSNQFNAWSVEDKWDRIEFLADYLLANGVIVPPCKVGDEVFVYNRSTQRIYKNRVYCVHIFGKGMCKNKISVEYKNIYGAVSERRFAWAQFGKTVFLTKEEAENALSERRNGDAE